MPRPKGDLQLAIGYWIVSHKQTLQKWWVISLMLFIFGSLVWTILFFSVFYQRQAATDNILYNSASRLGRLTLGLHRPQDLIPGTATILERDRQHVDLVASLENPNSDWGAVKVVFHWQLANQDTVSEEAFINPATTRPIISLNINVTSVPSTATLVVDDVAWARVGSASLPPAIFVTDSLTLTPTTITINGQSVSTASLKASVMNRSVYNYYRVVVPVIVRAGNRIVAVDILNLERWPTLTSRTIASSWSYSVSGATRAEIEPQVSQFAADNIYR